MEEDIWICLANVALNHNKSGILNGADCAYVNVLGYAKTDNDFIEKIKTGLVNLDLMLIEIEDVELFNERIAHWEVDIKILKIADEIKVDGKMKFGTFHTYHT